MNRKNKIWIALIVYLTAMMAMVGGVVYYIELKQERLRKEITEKFDDIFGGRTKIVDILYSGLRVEYSEKHFPDKQMTIKNILDVYKYYPDSYKDNLIKKFNDSYDEELDDLSKLYQLKYVETIEAPYKADGWNLFVLERKGKRKDWAELSFMFPYAVGFKKPYNEYTPSVPEAVKGAFSYYTTDEKSDIAVCFVKGSYETFKDIKEDAWNEYYYIKTEISEPIVSRMYEPLFFEYPDLESSYYSRYGYMYNGYYKVFVGKTPPVYMSIEYKDGSKESNTTILILIYGFVLTLLLIIYLYPIIKKIVKHKKTRKENLYAKLIRVSNPANFMDNYDKEKVDLANSIYNRLLNIPQSDNESVMVLLEEVENKLGIGIVDDELISELKEKINPKNFLKPYDAEKVALANDLYSRLSKDNITYKEIIEIQKESKKL